jgi:hypothetical protein
VICVTCGAPEEIRTPDPQIRRLVASVDPPQDYCKPDALGTLKYQRVSPSVANRKSASGFCCVRNFGIIALSNLVPADTMRTTSIVDRQNLAPMRWDERDCPAECEIGGQALPALSNPQRRATP